MIILPAILTTFRSLKDKTMKIEFETNELTPEQFMGLSQVLQSFGYLAFKKEKFKTEQLAVIDELKADYDDKTKTPSKRLRNTLFVAYSKNNEGFENFEEYYQYKMEKFIIHVKKYIEE